MREHLKKLEPYKLPDYPRRDKIRLDLNENPFGPAPEVVNAIRNISAEDLSVYPEYGTLERKIAQYVGVNPAHVVITNGADDAIKCVYEGNVSPGDHVLMPHPTYSMYEVYSDLCQAVKIYAHYKNDFKFPLDEFLYKIDSANLIVVVNPANPTGGLIDRDVFLKILEKAVGKPVILDETYWQFAGKTFAELVEDYENLFVIHSFSKLFALAGVRIGYVITRQRELIEKVIEPFRVSSLSVIAGLASLENLDYYDDVLAKLKKNRSTLVEKFQKLGFEAYDTETNFILVKAGNRAGFIKKHLFERGVLIKHYPSPGILENFLRISVGREEDIDALFSALREILPSKVLIFDMDGVLVDVRESYRKAIKETAEYFTGDEVSYEEIQEFKNRGGLNNDWDLTHEIIKSRGVNISRDEVIEKFQELFLGENFSGYINREKWVIDMDVLQWLFENYRLAVFTSRPKEEAFYTLKKYGADGFFDIVVSLDDVKETKPSPEGIHVILEKLGISPENAYFLGDTVDDMEAARRAGVTGIGVAPPGGNVSRYERLFKEHGAKYVIGSVNEIKEILLKLSHSE